MLQVARTPAQSTQWMINAMDNQQYDEEDSWSSSSTGQKQFQLKSY
jgi:hypothetical protein